MIIFTDSLVSPRSASCTTLFAKSHLLGNLLLQQSRETLALFDEAVVVAQNDLISRLPNEPLQHHPRIYLRWSHLPPFPEVHRSTIPKSADANKLLMVRGTIVRAAMPNMIEWEITWQCQSCRGHFTRSADLESYNYHPRPTSCEATPVNGKKCGSKKFEKVSAIGAHNSRDYQELKLQEQVQHLDMGSMPRSISVIVLDDQTGVCNAGDDVTVTGLVTRRWGELSFGVKPEVELIILARNIVLNNERKNMASTGGTNDEASREFTQFWQDNMDTPLLARNAILRSICPDIYGMYYVKLALAMVLAGGVRPEGGPGTGRGDSHLLMVGDPGTGKSQLLRFAAKIASRSVMTTGVGTTGAGLTAAAARDQRGDWGLEAGALVLADGGACCIDEFASIRTEDQASVHEAMEQQTIHMAKAGIVCQLHTRCSIIAATNPKTKYNVDQSISMNVALGGPLLSRFDIILVLRDEPDEFWDKAISSFILGERSKTAIPNSVTDDEDDADPSGDPDEALISMFQNGDFENGAKHRRSSRSSDINAMDTAFGAPTFGSPSRPYSAAPQSPAPHHLSDSQSNGGGGYAGSAGSITGSSQTLALEQSALLSRSNGVRSGSLLYDIWPIDKLQSYFGWIKSDFRPKLSPEVTIIGQRYYARQRQADNPDAARTTARLADSIVRLAQGHAKLMARSTAIVPDAIFAILLLESSLFTSAIGGDRLPAVRSFFPADPDADYPRLETMVLEHLGLMSLSTIGMHGAAGQAPTTPGGTSIPHLADELPRDQADPYMGHKGPELPRPFSGYNPSQPNYPEMHLQQNQRRAQIQTPMSPVETMDVEEPRKSAQIPPMILEFEDNASQVSGWRSHPKSTQASQASMVAPLHPSSAPPTALQAGSSQMTSTQFEVSQSPVFASSQSGFSQAQPSQKNILSSGNESAELIPLPPGSDADFGVWATVQAAPLRFTRDDAALQSSQMDTDDDFNV